MRMYSKYNCLKIEFLIPLLSQLLAIQANEW